MHEDAATPPTPPAPVMPPMPSALRSRADFHDAVRGSLHHVHSARSRRLYWLDPDFSAWPLEDAALLDDLTRWLRLPQRRLLLLAHSYEQLARECPRFVHWRRDWAHAIDAWTPCDGVEVRLPTLALDDGKLCLQLHDKQLWRGRLVLDETAARPWRDEIDALLQRCEAAFAVRTLGL